MGALGYTSYRLSGRGRSYASIPSCCRACVCWVFFFWGRGRRSPSCDARAHAPSISSAIRRPFPPGIHDAVTSCPSGGGGVCGYAGLQQWRCWPVCLTASMSYRHIATSPPAAAGVKSQSSACAACPPPRAPPPIAASWRAGMRQCKGAACHNAVAARKAGRSYKWSRTLIPCRTARAS